MQWLGSVVLYRPMHQLKNTAVVQSMADSHQLHNPDTLFAAHFHRIKHAMHHYCNDYHTNDSAQS